MGRRRGEGKGLRPGRDPVFLIYEAGQPAVMVQIGGAAIAPPIFVTSVVELAQLRLLSGQFPPALSGALDISLRPIEEVFQRRAARKTIELAIVRIGPIEGTVGLDSSSRRNAERIEVVKFPLHRCRRHPRLPNTFGVGGARRAGLRTRHGRGRRQQRGKSYGNPRVRHGAPSIAKTQRRVNRRLT